MESIRSSIVIVFIFTFINNVQGQVLLCPMNGISIPGGDPDFWPGPHSLAQCNIRCLDDPTCHGVDYNVLDMKCFRHGSDTINNLPIMVDPDVIHSRKIPVTTFCASEQVFSSTAAPTPAPSTTATTVLTTVPTTAVTTPSPTTAAPTPAPTTAVPTPSTTAAKGIKGWPGDTGAAGPIGPTGAKGPDGVPGAAGQVGPFGPQGPNGPIGLPGIQGNPGANGVNGRTGPTGPKGYPGSPGRQGPKGHRGPPGASLLGPGGRPGPPGRLGVASNNLRLNNGGGRQRQQETVVRFYPRVMAKRILHTVLGTYAESKLSVLRQRAFQVNSLGFALLLLFVCAGVVAFLVHVRRYHKQAKAKRQDDEISSIAKTTV